MKLSPISTDGQSAEFDDLAFRRLRHSLTRQMNMDICDYWNRLRAGRRIPRRRDFNPADVPRILPSIILLDVVRPELDFRYRLIGTRWVDHFGRDDTGCMMSQIPHQAPPSQVWNACEEVVATGMPAAPNLPYVGAIFGNSEIEVLILPWTRECDSVDFLLATVDFRR